MLHDRYYHAARATEERKLAMASINFEARAIHLEMAAKYDARAEANTERWPAAQLVGVSTEHSPSVARS